MGKRKRKRRRKGSGGSPAGEASTWLDGDGLHVAGPGAAPDAATLEEMTRAYQDKIRKSPLWGQMVREYGEEKAAELLAQFRVEAR